MNKKKFWKIFFRSISIFFVLFSIALPTKSFAANPVLTFSPPTLNVPPDKTFDVTMNIDATANNYDVSSFDVTLVYNPKIVTVTLRNITTAYNKEVISTNDTTEGEIRLAKANLTAAPIKGVIPLAILSVKTNGSGVAIIQPKGVTITAFGQKNDVLVDVPNPLTINISNDFLNSNQPFSQPCIKDGKAGRMTDLGCIPNEPTSLIGQLYGYGLSIIGGISLLLLMYSGFLILSSQGNSEKIGRGKSYIRYAIGGLLLAIFGYTFVQIILVNVLHVPGIQ